MSTVPLTTVRAPAKDRTRANTLKRERHEPEYGILVATVALAAIGILMVYSSSAIKAYLSKGTTRSRSWVRRSSGPPSGSSPWW